MQLAPSPTGERRARYYNCGVEKNRGAASGSIRWPSDIEVGSGQPYLLCVILTNCVAP